MVSYKMIMKVIEDYAKKHPITEKLKNIGKTGKWETYTDENGGITGSSLTYKDGTSIKYDKDGNITGIITDYGEKIPYIGKGITMNMDFYNFDVENLKYELGTVDYRIIKDFVINYRQNHYINRYLRGKATEQEMRAELGDRYVDKMLRDMDNVCEILDNNNLLKNYVFLSVRGVRNLHDNDNINKRIVSDEGFTSSSVGANTTFIQKMYSGDNGWTILTLYEYGNPASTGLYTGYIFEDNGSYDIDQELITMPKQKFERTIIDEQNKIIIQRPYHQNKPFDPTDTQNFEINIGDLPGYDY